MASKKKRRPISFQVMAWLAKGVWFLIAGTGKLIVFGFRKAKEAKERKDRERKRKPILKHPAQYSEVVPKSITKGSFGEFQKRLLNESLIVIICGKRGSGKSALGFRLLENIHARSNRPCMVLGVRQELLPGWITTLDDIDHAKNSSIVLVDEAALSFNAREAMKAENKDLGKLMAIARHKDLTLLLVTQNTSMIDKNILNLCDTIMLKEGSLLQLRMERSVLKEFYQQAETAFEDIPKEERKRYAFVYDDDFEGLCLVDLPSFWSANISKNQA